MADKKIFLFGTHGGALRNQSGIGERFLDCPFPRQAFLSSADALLFAQFLEFCKLRNINFAKESSEEKGFCDSSSFKADLLMYFGDELPSNVVDQLCKLVEETSRGKCVSCMLPVESLILSVLHILHDATQIDNQVKGNIDSVVLPNVKDIQSDSADQDFAKHCSKKPSVVCAQGTKDITNGITDACEKRVSGHESLTPAIEGSDLFHGKDMKNPILILDTPLVKGQGKRHFDQSLSFAATRNIMTKKPRVQLHSNERSNEGNVAQTMDIVGVDFVARGKAVETGGAKSLKDGTFQVGMLCDDLYNKRHLSKKAVTSSEVVFMKENEQSSRFPVSDVELGLYTVICKLARSQWSCSKAVQFSLTSLTFNSFGESVEPLGRVDNFFVACMCRKFFEDVHPKKSKKHFFYPKVGGCLYTYNCSYDEDIVRKSFLGANSAYKLHLSEKLCFPVVIDKHWFVFIVDIKNKQFVFLDSFFSRTDKFQVDASRTLINSFKDCWYEHAEVKLDVDVFSVAYPAVPKQKNLYDCGIFAVLFMELWDQNIDLRSVFDHYDIPNLRVKLAIDLFFNKANCIDKSRVIELYEKRIDPSGLQRIDPSGIN